jgi:hypothetical protein
VLLLLLVFLLLGGGGYVAGVYANVLPAPKFLAGLLGKRPGGPARPVGPVRPVKPVRPRKAVRQSPQKMKFGVLAVSPVQPLQGLRLEAGEHLEITWKGNRPTPPKNAEELVFSLEKSPEGMTLDPASGVLRWTPGLAGDIQVPSMHTAVIKAVCGQQQATRELRVRVRYRLGTPREVNFSLDEVHRSSRDHVGLAFADFDGDARPDLAAACGRALDGRLTIMLSAGGGTDFSRASDWMLGGAPAGMCAADLDGDGHTDLGWAEWMSGRLMMLRGAAGRAPGKAVRLADAPEMIDAMTLADLNGDGISEVVAASRRAGRLLVHKPGGGQLAETPLRSAGLPPKLLRLSASRKWGGADRVGLVISGGTAAGRLLVLALEKGKLVRQQELKLPKGVVECARGGDLDGDGWSDAVLLYGGRRGALVAVNGAPPGKMALLEPVPVGALPLGMDIGEINGDGRADLVISSPEEMRVFLSCGRGRFLEAGAVKVLGCASPVALWPSIGGRPARAAVLNLKGRAWVLQLPTPRAAKDRPGAPEVPKAPEALEGPENPAARAGNGGGK